MTEKPEQPKDKKPEKKPEAAAPQKPAEVPPAAAKGAAEKSGQAPAEAGHKRGDRSRGRGPRRRPRRRERAKEPSEFVEKVVTINRVSKVVSGGKNFSFGALVVVGDGKGRVGFAVGKAREVQDAIRKGIEHAKAAMVRVPLKGATIPHQVVGVYGAAKVLLKPASEGTGVIAGSTVRAVCDSAGIRDILTKSLGSETPLNVVRATMAGMEAMISKERLEAGMVS